MNLQVQNWHFSGLGGGHLNHTDRFFCYLHTEIAVYCCYLSTTYRAAKLTKGKERLETGSWESNASPHTTQISSGDSQ